MSASFWDKDFIPVYDPELTQKYEFSGRRVHRGIYKTSTDKLLNADLNGALNILRKSNVVSLDTLYSSGVVLTPTRVRIL
jgi:transposase